MNADKERKEIIDMAHRRCHGVRVLEGHNHDDKPFNCGWRTARCIVLDELHRVYGLGLEHGQRRVL
jgi:hypothetical protein